MRSVKAALAIGGVLLIVAIGAVLSRSPPVIAGTNSVPSFSPIGSSYGEVSSCQQVGTLPKDTSAIRVSLAAAIGPRLHVTVLSSSRVVTQGERPAGWGLESNVSIPVKKVTRTIPNAVVCTAIGRAIQPVSFFGLPIKPGATGNLALKDVKLRIEYLRPGPRSWWSLLSSISHRMGLGHAAGGRWLSFLVLATMIAVIALATRLTLREVR